MSITARDDLPDEPRELAKLAGLLHYETPEKLLADCQHYTSRKSPAARAAVRRHSDELTSRGIVKVDRLRAACRSSKHEDLAVAHAAGAGDFDDLADDLFDAAVVDPQRDLDLGQKGQRVFAVGVLVEIALLPAVAFDLAHAARLERRPLESFQTFSARYGLTMATICFTASA